MTESKDLPTSDRARKPLTRYSRGMLLLFLTLLLVGLDQATKLYAVEHWKNQPPQSFFNDIFRIEYAENHGAFLSLLANMPDDVRFWILTVINGAVLIGIAVSLLIPRRMAFYSFLPLALVVAGGLGNLIDRVRFNFVIDFLNLGIGGLRTGIFNVADMAITAGFFLMVPLLLQKDPAKAAAPSSIDPLSTACPQRPAT